MSDLNTENLSNHCKNCLSFEKGIFCHLEKIALNEVEQYAIKNTFKKGQTLFVEGAPTYGVYCISSGNIKITKVDPNGKETIVRLASKGDILGHRSVFSNQPYLATATALEDTTACFIDKKYILKLVQKETSVAIDIISRLGKDMGEAEKKIASFHQKNVRERLAEFLLILKDGHGVQCSDGKISLDIKLTREEMASIIGSATETLIRFMSELKDKGYIEQKGKRIFITNVEGLQTYTNP